MKKLFVTFILFIFCICISSQPAHAYIGPGAGFAVLGSGVFIILSILLGVISLLFLPFKFFIKKIRKLGVPSSAKFKRVMVIGYDGLDPKLFKKFSLEGKLPHLTKLSEIGSFKEVQTTIPALSPVAWSSFQTGVNPGAHNIFDFLTRDKRSYLPQLASSELQDVKGKMIPFITRKSKPFWHHLGKKGIPSTILRVPISYPPEPFGGRILSAMTTPDLLGTQGTFCLYSTNAETKEKISGINKKLKFQNGSFTGSLSGPLESEVSFSVTPTSNNLFTFEICGEKLILKPKVFSPWISVRFGKQKTKGIIKVRINEAQGENLVLYISPINIDPESPALPISEPPLFSRWIAKTQGLFGTLGFLEDTWGRNEGALNDEGFLEQAWENFEERRAMLFETMKNSPNGFLSCVFDTTDRVQHMFWRYLEDDHPAPKEDVQKSFTAIEDLYTRFDALTGEILSKLTSDDLLFIISDHGFGSFKRAINFNTWLMKEGYLVLKEKCDDFTTHDYLKNVDWSKTKAFGIGLTGLYINKKNREPSGIVEESECKKLLLEIKQKLLQLKDPENGLCCIEDIYFSSEVYKGMYVEEAPDLIIGGTPGYRVSWESVTGGIREDVFSDNLKAWTGDHHINPPHVPGVCFSNIKITDEIVTLLDFAPTILDNFKVVIPSYLEGKVLKF